MTRIANTNYQASSSVQFEKANSDSDQFDAADVQKLAEALDTSDHSDGLGLPVARVAATSILPATTDGAALGSASAMFSDLFLASGAVVNFNNGDVTLTHAANALAFAGASSGYSFDGGVSLAGALTLTPSTSKIVPGATALQLRNNADSANNLLLSDAGAVTMRGLLTVSSGGMAVTGDSTVTGNLTANKGSDASSFLQAGNGGSAPSTNRSASLVLAAPSVAGTLGFAFVDYRRDATQIWSAGVWHSALGVAGANTDFVWRPNGDAVMALSTGGTLALGGSLFLGDTSNAFSTKGVTINNGGSANEMITLKTSTAHGMSTPTETDTCGSLAAVGSSSAGLAISGWGSGSVALRFAGNAATSDTTKDSAALGAVTLVGTLKSGGSVGSMAANANVLAVINSGATKFILDADGDSHQDVGTAWTNFDAHDDLALLDATSALLDPGSLRKSFSEDFLAEHRATLAANRVVTFNDDGRHFVNWSRFHMLHMGATRYLGDRLAAMAETIAAQAAEVAGLKARLALADA